MPIKKILFGTCEGIEPFYSEECSDAERQFITLQRNKNGCLLSWMGKNNHLYSSIVGSPMWIPIGYYLGKINPTNQDLVLLVSTNQKIDVFDYVKEIKNLIKPEMFSILTSGLSGIIGLKDD